MKLPIAIVDDRDYLRTHTSTALEATGEIEVKFSAVNGQDFLNKMKASEPPYYPEVVLMDIEMPILDGIEAVRQATALYPSIRFLMLTVFDDDDKLFEAIKAGAVGYLLKDEKIDFILASIKGVVAFGGAPMSPRIARKSLQLLSKATFAPIEKAPLQQPDADGISEREMEILKHMVDGLDYKEIATKLYISPFTVRTHITNIYKKLHVTSKVQAVTIALKRFKL